MSQLDKCIEKRRSIRKYKETIPDDELIKSMIQSALYAPSASHSQPVRFIRISSLEMKDAFIKSLHESYEDLRRSAAARENSKKIKIQIDVFWKYTKFMFNVPILFAIGVEKNVKGLIKLARESNLIDVKTLNSTSADMAVGLALQNFILKGEELNLGTCILTTPFIINPNIADVLNVDDVDIKCFVTVGYADEIPVLYNRKTVNEIYRDI